MSDVPGVERHSSVGANGKTKSGRASRGCSSQLHLPEPVTRETAIAPNPVRETGSENAPNESAIVADLESAIEPIPEADAPGPVVVAYVNRLYKKDQILGRKALVVRHRIGAALILLKTQTPHGQWEAKVEKEFPFTLRSANNYMNLARAKTSEQIEGKTLTDVYLELGITNGELSCPLIKAVRNAAKKHAVLLKQMSDLRRRVGEELRRHEQTIKREDQVISEIYRDIRNMKDGIKGNPYDVLLTIRPDVEQVFAQRLQLCIPREERIAFRNDC